MKFLVALALVLVAATAVSALTDERKAQLKVWGQECVTSTGVDTAKITALRRGEFIEDAALKNFLACVYQKAGSLNDDGTFNKDVVFADLGDATIKAAVSKCVDVTASTPAESAWLSYKCFRTSVPADYKTPW